MSVPGDPAPGPIAASLVRGRWWIAGAAATAAALTVWLVVATPARWLSSAQLELVDPGIAPTDVVALMRGGAVTQRLGADRELAARLGDGGEPAPAAMSRVLADQVRVVPGDGAQVWVTAWDRDGELARDLVVAIVEAAAEVDLERRRERLAERLAGLEAERLALDAALRDAAAAATAIPLDDVVVREVGQARLRLLAERLAAVEQALTGDRAAEPAPAWRVAEPPVPWQHPLPRRLGAPVAAALSLPLLVAALCWLAHDRRRG